MSEWGRVANSCLWAGVPVCVAAALLTAAMGAAATVLGLVPVENAWVWIGICWGLAGLVGGRFAARGEKRTLLWAILYVAAAILLMWLIGLTAEGASLSRHSFWYIGAGFMGAILGVSLPRRRKKRRQKGRGSRIFSK